MEPLATRVAARFAKEFPNQEALDEYLKEHPGADKSKHTVKKTPHSLRDRAEEHGKAERHDQAALDYMAAAELFRRQNSPEAAKAMEDKATEHARKWHKEKTKKAMDPIAARVAARFAKDFSSPEALKTYLKEHPNADPKNHHVVTPEGGRGSGAAHVKVKVDTGVADDIGKVWKGKPEGAITQVKKMIDDGRDVPVNMIEKAVKVLHDQANNPTTKPDEAKAMRALRDKLKGHAHGKEAATYDYDRRPA